MKNDSWNFDSNSSFGSFDKTSSNTQSFGSSQSGFSGGSSGNSGFFGGGSFGSFGSSASNNSQQDSGFAEGSPWSGGERSDNAKPGGWCVSMTVASLISIGFAFLLSYLFKDIQRNVPLFGLFFFGPAALLMLLVLLIEHVSSPMNPHYSRKAQCVIALVLAAAIFLIGCTGEFIHEYVTVSPSQYIIVLDKSGSMTGTSDEKTMDAVEKLLETIPDRQRVGYVAFCDRVLGTVDINDASASRSRITSTMRRQLCTGGTDFFNPLSRALDMIKDTNVTTRILMITDGMANISSSQLLQLENSCAAKNASISCVYINVSTNNELRHLVTATGGTTAYVNKVEAVLEGVMSIGVAKETDLFHTMPKAGRDMIISAVILFLASVAVGVALTLMLSRHGQKRFQLILSPLFGIAAFLVMNFIAVPGDTAWIVEGAAQSLPLLVFMRRNS